MSRMTGLINSLHLPSLNLQKALTLLSGLSWPCYRLASIPSILGAVTHMEGHVTHTQDVTWTAGHARGLLCVCCSGHVAVSPLLHPFPRCLVGKVKHTQLCLFQKQVSPREANESKPSLHAWWQRCLSSSWHWSKGEARTREARQRETGSASRALPSSLGSGSGHWSGLPISNISWRWSK